MSIPICSSLFSALTVDLFPLKTFLARSSATSPPGKIPSSIAALVAPTASLTLSFLSFNSISVAAPTLI
jgi:hypothetical protein